MAVTWKKLAYEIDVVLKSVITTTGDIIYASAANTPARLGIGSAADVLTVSGGVHAWAAPAAPAHKDSHDPEDGADKLDTAAPAELASVQAAGAGSSHSFARADHAHQIQESFADNHIVTVNAADVASNDIARFSATGGLNGMTYAELAAVMALDDIGNPDAAVKFNGQQASNFIIHQVADAAALAALTPVVGKLAMQVDTLAAYICTVAA
jgi:hypothetical protein